MSDLLDDGVELTIQELLSRYQRKFGIATVVLTIVGTLWGIVFYYFIKWVENNGGGELLIVSVFFGLNLLLLLIYALVNIKNIWIVLGYTALTYCINLGLAIAVVDEFGMLLFRTFDRYSLAPLCCIAGIMSTMLLWILPIQYKKIDLTTEQLNAQIAKNSKKYHVQLSIVFAVLALIWGWGYQYVEDYIEYVLSNKTLSFFLITTGLIFLYKQFFLGAVRKALLYTIIELGALALLWVFLIEYLDLGFYTLPYIVVVSALVIIVLTYRADTKIRRS